MNFRTPLVGRILIVESDRALGAMYADLIATHCPGLRIDVCRPEDHTLVEDNAGGADVALCTCGPAGAPCFDALRRLITVRPCLAILALVPADRPALADEAIGAGATDVLLRAPGYLDQLPVTIRKNIALTRRAAAAGAREQQLIAALQSAQTTICDLQTELADRASSSRAESAEAIPLPIVMVRRPSAKAA